MPIDRCTLERVVMRSGDEVEALNVELLSVSGLSGVSVEVSAMKECGNGDLIAGSAASYYGHSE
jgi:hypothetical protein